MLSLDAPMVAVAWALVFAKSAQVRLPSAEVAALGLLVWLIYTVDRLLDGCFPALAASNQAAVLPGEGAFGSPLRQRHAFHREHARAITWIASGVAVLTSFLIFSQTNAESFRAAVPLACVLLLYLAWVHVGRGRVLAKLPKEVAVGGIFAAGVALPVWTRLGARRWEFFLLVILFAAVCTLNCVAIEEWERVRGDARDTGSASRRSESGNFAIALAGCAAMLTPVVRLRGEFSTIGASIAVSALLILALDMFRERISIEGMRVLVDVALLVPALAVLAFVR